MYHCLSYTVLSSCAWSIVKFGKLFFWILVLHLNSSFTSTFLVSKYWKYIKEEKIEGEEHENLKKTCKNKNESKQKKKQNEEIHNRRSDEQKEKIKGT